VDFEIVNIRPTILAALTFHRDIDIYQFIGFHQFVHILETIDMTLNPVKEEYPTIIAIIGVFFTLFPNFFRSHFAIFLILLAPRKSWIRSALFAAPIATVESCSWELPFVRSVQCGILTG